jgi:hypothetical protein
MLGGGKSSVYPGLCERELAVGEAGMVSRMRGCGGMALSGLELVIPKERVLSHAGPSTPEVSHESKLSIKSRSPADSRD